MAAMPPTADELLAHYAAMFAAGRERRMKIEIDGELVEYSLVVQRIERVLSHGVVRDDDVETLRKIAAVFREAKAEKESVTCP